MASALDALRSRGQREEQQQRQDEQRAEFTEKYLPPTLKRLMEQKARTEAGEDPRVTQFYQRTESPIMQYLPEPLRQRAIENQQRQFYDTNPDLDPRLADERVEKDGQQLASEEIAQNVLKAIVAGTKEGVGFDEANAAAKAIATYNSVKDQLSDAVKKKYGLDELEKQGFLEQDQSTGNWKSNLGQFVSTPGIKQALEGIDRFGQANLTAVGELRDGDPLGAIYAGAHAGDPRTYLPGGDKRVEDMVRQSGVDLNGDGRIENFREAVGNDPGDITIGGRGLGLLDMIASAVVDPTSWVSFGTPKLAKAGLEMARRQGLDAVANQIRKAGWKSLDDVQRAEFRRAIQASIDEVSDLAIKNGGAEGAAEKILAGVGRGGQKGVKVAGRTVPVPSFRSAGGEGSSAVSSVNRVNSWDIIPDDTIEELGGAVVKSYDPETRMLVVDAPTEKIAVLRKGETITVSPSELEAGDAFLGGEAKVANITEDGIELELGRLLDQVERPFGILPRHQTGTQGTLVGRKTVDAPPVEPGDQRTISPGDPGRSEPAANVRLSDVGREAPPMDQGRLVGDVAPGRMADDPIRSRAAEVAKPVDPIEAVKNAPSATDAGGYASVVERQLAGADARNIGDGMAVKAVDDGAGGKIIAIVDENDDMLGYLMATDDAINTFESLVSTKGMGQRLLKAAADEGLDVPRLLANSDFTDDVIDEVTGAVTKRGGRSTALRYLEGQKAPAAAGPLADRAAVPRIGNRRIDTISYPVRKPNGVEIKGRIWREDRKPVTAGFELLDADGSTLGTVVDWVGENAQTLRLAPANEVPAVGAKLPSIRGLVQAVNDDGTVDVVLDYSLADNAAEAVTSPQVTAPADPSPIVSRARETRAPREDVGASVTLREGDEALDAADAYTDPKIRQETARVRAGKTPKEADEELQQALFERGFISTEHIEAGDRMPSIRGTVKKKLAGRNIIADLDPDQSITVVRDDKLELLGAADVKTGDLMVDSALTVVRRNADGTLTLKGIPMHALREGIEKQMGGIASEATFAQKVLEKKFGDAIRTWRDSFDPRASIEASERAGRLPGQTAARIGRATAQERARLENAITDMQRRLGSVQKRLEKDLGLREARETLSAAFDVDSSGASRAAAEADNLDALGRTKAAAALRTMDEIVKEIKAIRIGDDGQQALAGATSDAQMPLILTKTGRKALAMEPGVAQDLLGLQRQLDNITAGFDFSEAAGRGVLRIEAPGKPGTFLEIDLSRPAREVNEQIAEAVSESTRQALRIGDDAPLRIFEENPLTAYSFRNRTAQTQAIQADLVTKLADDGVLTLVPKGSVDDPFYQQAEALARRRGHVEVPGWESPMGKTFAPPEVAKEMSKMRAIIRNDAELRTWKRNLDKMSATWTRQVLSPITKGFAYPLRNLQSNLVSAMFGGLTPQGQALATKLQAGPLRRIGKLMREEGLSYDAALAKASKAGGEVDPRHATLLRYLREDDIMNTGQYRVLDWGDTVERGTAGADATSKIGRFAKKRLDPLSGDNILLAPGRLVNTMIEDNARMALYISVFDATGSREAAREAVVKYLFDYADLTPFESNVMKSINVFYTFVRKNTALQMKVFADRPALAINTLRAKNNLSAGAGSGLQYPGEDDTTPAGGFLQSIMGGPGVVRIDDPVTSAIRTIDPFIQTAYAGLDKITKGKLGEVMPQDEMPTGRSITSGYLGLTSGAPAAFVTTLFELNTGVDTFTGRPIEGDAFDRIVETVAPVWKQGHTLATDYDDSAALRKNLLRMLTGLTFTRREGGSESLMWAMSAELEETLLQLKAQGVDVPSIEDLRTAGLIPALSTGGPQARTVPLPKEDRREAALSKLLGE